MQITKQKLTDLFEGTQTYEEMAEQFTADAGIEVSPKMVRDLFRANGFNLRSRKRKTADAWFTIIDDTVTETVPEFQGAEEV